MLGTSRLDDAAHYFVALQHELVVPETGLLRIGERPIVQTKQNTS